MPPGLDLGQIEHVVDQAEQVAAVGLDVGERLAQFGRHLAVELVEDDLGEAQDRVQRRAQLVAHVGQEFRLGAAGHLEAVV